MRGSCSLRAHRQCGPGDHRLDFGRVFRPAVSVRVINRPKHEIESLRREAASCQACPLWEDATQTVFGEAPQDAEIMLGGEQPGVGKTVKAAGSLNRQGLILDKALREAGVERKRVHVTNAVKHSKFESRGKRRFHKVRTLARSRYAGVGYSRRLSDHPSVLLLLLEQLPRRVDRSNVPSPEQSGFASDRR
jgi:hypothetical protein